LWLCGRVDVVAHFSPKAFRLHKGYGGASFKCMSASGSNPARLISHMLAALFNSRAAFLEHWRQYEKSNKPPDGLAGRWVGEWICQLSGHHGELKCVLSQISPGVYRAYFYATFSRLFRVGYVTDLSAAQVDGQTRLKGEQDLGTLAGGVYRCEGTVTGTRFECHYSCKYDQGIFRLERLD
jgi:hypothetical protein